MTKQEYLDGVKQCPDNAERIKTVSDIYEIEINGIVAKIVSFSDNADFIGEERRALSYKEILNASREYEKDFKSLGIIPVIDAYDNELIVYIICERLWAKYSLSDEVLYKKKDSLDKLL